MVKKADKYPAATLEIEYPPKLDRVTTFFRLIMAIPIMIVLSLISAADSEVYTHAGQVTTEVTRSGMGITGGIFIATALMIVVRQRYPRWWFNFVLEFSRFSARVGAYLFLLTDKYPSTEDTQSVHLNVTYPNVKRDLDRFRPIFKWVLLIPHYVVLVCLYIAVVAITVVAWFAILFTGRYPKNLFDFVVGVGRWSLRVEAYGFLLVTDEYPPFRLT